MLVVPVDARVFDQPERHVFAPLLDHSLGHTMSVRRSNADISFLVYGSMSGAYSCRPPPPCRPAAGVDFFLRERFVPFLVQDLPHRVHAAGVVKHENEAFFGALPRGAADGGGNGDGERAPLPQAILRDSEHMSMTV